QARGARILLGLTSPSRRDVAGAAALVDESLSGLARYAAQSSGFELGVPRAAALDQWAVEPRIDYRSGLFQVVIVAPETIQRGPEDAPRDELCDGRWASVRANSSGEPSVAREGREIGA